MTTFGVNRAGAVLLVMLGIVALWRGGQVLERFGGPLFWGGFLILMSLGLLVIIKLDDRRFVYFLDQTRCVDGFMRDFADLLGADDVVVFVGDHGTDRLYGPLQEGVQSNEAIVERMNVLAATRVKKGCDVGERVLTAT